MTRTLPLLVLGACTIVVEGQGTGPSESGDSGFLVPPRYHPDDYAEPDVHGMDAKLQAQDCRTCHGQELTGSRVEGANDSEVSCDDCHEEGWRTNCVYCHGGQLDQTGAPPRDIDGETDLDLVSFRAHDAHVTDGLAGAYSCDQCHEAIDQVLDLGHVFDDTPEQAEVDMTKGIATRASWDGTTCSDVYCHGNAYLELGDIDATHAPMECGDCHPGPEDQQRWGLMSGRHALHMNEASIGCSSCHFLTVDADAGIVGPSNHVNGTVDVALDPGEPNDIAIGDTCNGSCHEEYHELRSWSGQATTFFNDVWPILSSPEHDCTLCHGSDGAPSGFLLSNSATAWQTLLEGTPQDTSSFAHYVVPGEYRDSLLYEKLANDDPRYDPDPDDGVDDARMPALGVGTGSEFDALQYLDSDELAVVRAWIEEGAVYR